MSNAERRQVPARITWAVNSMALQPGEQVLEVGFGNGMAIALVHKLIAPDGHIHAIDQSEISVERASVRNSWALKHGLVSVAHAALAAAELEEGRYDVVFANNLNLFWTGDATTELAQVARALAPGGRFYLTYDAPRPAKAAEIGQRVLAALQADGWVTTVLDSPTGTQWGVHATR